MLIASMVLAGLAAALHVYIWWLEAFAWERPGTMRTFGVGSEAEAATTRSMAFNQGFYNLFLAGIAIAGIVALALGAVPVGTALMLAGCGSMLLAAIVLVSGSRAHASAAVKQGTLPLLAVICVAIAGL